MSTYPTNDINTDERDFFPDNSMSSHTSSDVDDGLSGYDRSRPLDFSISMSSPVQTFGFASRLGAGVSSSQLDFQQMYAHHPHHSVSLDASVVSQVPSAAAMASPLMGVITSVKMRCLTPSHTHTTMPASQGGHSTMGGIVTQSVGSGRELFFTSSHENGSASQVSPLTLDLKNRHSNKNTNTIIRQFTSVGTPPSLTAQQHTTGNSELFEVARAGLISGLSVDTTGSLNRIHSTGSAGKIESSGCAMPVNSASTSATLPVFAYPSKKASFTLQSAVGLPPLSKSRGAEPVHNSRDHSLLSKGDASAPFPRTNSRMSRREDTMDSVGTLRNTYDGVQRFGSQTNDPRTTKTNTHARSVDSGREVPTIRRASAGDFSPIVPITNCHHIDPLSALPTIAITPNDEQLPIPIDEDPIHPDGAERCNTFDMGRELSRYDSSTWSAKEFLTSHEMSPTALQCDRELHLDEIAKTVVAFTQSTPAESAAIQSGAPPTPKRRPPSAFAANAFTFREATAGDAEGIIALGASLDMTNATSFVWPLEELKTRIKDRFPLVIVAVTTDAREDSPTNGQEIVVGVSGVDLRGMEKDFPIRSIGSRLLGVPANSDFVFPDTYCMCRGLLIHAQYQGAGLGSKLHKGRMQLLAKIAPETPGVILSARGSTIEETLSVVVPHISARDSAATPEFTKDDLFEFTFHTSQGIVHMVHGKERDGWKFVGVDIADGGPVWVTSKPLPEVVAVYDVVVSTSVQAPTSLTAFAPSKTSALQKAVPVNRALDSFAMGGPVSSASPISQKIDTA